MEITEKELIIRLSEYDGVISIFNYINKIHTPKIFFDTNNKEIDPELMSATIMGYIKYLEKNK